MDTRYQKIRKQAGLVAAIFGSLLIGLPAMAMPRMEVDKQLAQANPHPRIFDEPPYNHSGSTSGMQPGMGSMGQPNLPPTSTTQPDQTGTMGGQSNSPASSTSPQNPNQPATNVSPYLQQQQTGGASQPQKPTGGETPSRTSPQNPNQPATNVSPYLQQQQTGGATQPGTSK